LVVRRHLPAGGVAVRRCCAGLASCRARHPSSSPFLVPVPGARAVRGDRRDIVA